MQKQKQFSNNIIFIKLIVELDRDDMIIMRNHRGRGKIGRTNIAGHERCRDIFKQLKSSHHITSNHCEKNILQTIA